MFTLVWGLKVGRLTSLEQTRAYLTLKLDWMVAKSYSSSGHSLISDAFVILLTQFTGWWVKGQLQFFDDIKHALNAYFRSTKLPQKVE
jgi:hypothetical protein